MGTPTSEDELVEVVQYSDSWPTMFLSEAALLHTVLSPWLVAEIEHVGSTAVVGLHAKPIIDIMAPVQELQSSTSAIEVAQSVGYCYYPYKPDEMHWFCKPTPTARTHHLHLIPWKSRLWQERLAFRDALRMNPALAQEYCSLKLRLAKQYPHDREAYTDGKAPFIASVVRSSRAVVPGAA